MGEAIQSAALSAMSRLQVSGRVKIGDTCVRIAKDGTRERAHVTAIFSREGLAKVGVKHASAGDIIGLCGFADAFIGETAWRARRTRQPGRAAPRSRLTGLSHCGPLSVA